MLASFLEAGFSVRPELWLVACRYTALNLSLPAPGDDTRATDRILQQKKPEYMRAKLKECYLVSLCSTESKFCPNAASGLFAGWRLINKPLALEGPSSFAVLSCGSRLQNVVSRSSTEAEIVSLGGALFSDAVPMLDVWESLIPSNQACIALVKKGFSAKLRHLAKAHRENVASTCELVNMNENILL